MTRQITCMFSCMTRVCNDFCRIVQISEISVPAHHERGPCAWSPVLGDRPHWMLSVSTTKATSFGAYSECVQVLLDAMHEVAGQGPAVKPRHLGNAMHPHATRSSTTSTNFQELSILTEGLPEDIESEIHELNAEGLLVLLATAIEKKNVRLTKHFVRALEKFSSVDGEPSERVNAYFLHALVCRAGSMLDSSLQFGPDHPTFSELQWSGRKLSVNELTSFIDMTPFYRFGYIAANGALLEAFEGMERVHILDFSTTYCMQWPTLIDALADRMDGPPHVRLTVSNAKFPTSSRLLSTYEELGYRLAAFSGSKGVPFEFQILPQPLELLQVTDFDIRDGEALGVNCAFRMHYLEDEAVRLGQSESSAREGAFQAYSAAGSPCSRDNFLRLIGSLNPAIVTLYEEDCNTTSTDLVTRLKQSYNYEWMPFDFLATYSQNVNRHRAEHEKDVGRKIKNIIACEGIHRIERLESKDQWLHRMLRLQFRTVRVSEDVVSALKDMLSYHAAGWGMKLAEDNTQILSWKGHSLAFASSWVPIPLQT